MPNAFHTRPGALRRSWQQGQVFFADYNGPLLAVTVLASDLLRIRLAPAGSFAARRSWAVAPPDTDYPPANFVVDQSQPEISITTEQLTVLVAREGGRVSICERDGGRTVLVDGPDGGPAWDEAAGG